MESAKLKIVLHSGKDLGDVKHLSRMDPYVVVWISGDRKESKRQTTPIAENGACNPEWEYSMEFDIAAMNQDYILVFEIFHDGTFVDRKIGQVQVPFLDLLATDAPRDKVSYPVTTPSGEKKGEIIVSHNFSESAMTSDEDKGSDDCKSKAGSPHRKKKHGIAKEIAKKVTQTLVLTGAEAATTFLVETFACD